ncbi:hypothetical protein [Chitinimonas naiadis]
MCRERGFALIAALFLLVVLSAIGAFVLTLSTTSQQSNILDFQGSRAYQAARAGIEYAAYRALNGSVCSNTDLNLGGQMADFTINLQCSSSTHNVAGNTVTIYQLTATACNLPSGNTCGPSQRSLNYVERQLSASVSRCVDGSGGSCV